MWFTRFIWQGPLTPQTHQKNNKIKRKKQKQTNKKKTLPPAHPLCYATNTITWWQTKKTSSAYTTNTTGKCDAPPTSTALPSPQRCPLNKGGGRWFEKTESIDWWAVRSWSSFSCNVTEPKIKKERDLFPHPDPLIIFDQCVSLTTSDRLPPSAQQRPRWPHFFFPPLEKWLIYFCGFVSNTPNGTTPPPPWRVFKKPSSKVF